MAAACLFGGRLSALPRLTTCSVKRTSLVFHNLSQLLCTEAAAGSLTPTGEVTIEYRCGLPVAMLPLPSRREVCQFTLKPVTQTVDDLCTNIRGEDKGVDFVGLYLPDGTRVARSTPIEHVLQFERFLVRVNDRVLLAQPPAVAAAAAGDAADGLPELTSEHWRRFGDVKAQVGALYAALNVDEHQLKLERDLVAQLENLKIDLLPLQETKDRLAAASERRTTRVLWCGLGALGLQAGLFGRLTWWEYSWDIMEPVTYFATFSTVIGVFGYYLVTKQPYEYAEAKDRLFLSSFHRQARRVQFDVAKYNRLREKIAEVEYDLRRLRDPLYLHLPLSRLSSLKHLN